MATVPAEIPHHADAGAHRSPDLDPPVSSFHWTSAAREASVAVGGGGTTMDDDRRELAIRLVAAATAMLEDAAVVAAAGQSPRLSAAQIEEHGGRLKVAAQAVAILAEAAAIVADPDIVGRQSPRKRRR